jgi:hypothetical protein
MGRSASWQPNWGRNGGKTEGGCRSCTPLRASDPFCPSYLNALPSTLVSVCRLKGFWMNPAG